MIAFQAFVIIGGVIKLIPLTGVTLPLVSYGGTGESDDVRHFAVGLRILRTA